MLLHSFSNLKRLKYDIKIVPVCINYDRLFDASYLANEMISGKMEQINLFDLLRYINSMRAGKLGKVFVKYADPIDLNEYIAANGGCGPNLSLKLTRDLYQIHQKEQPITMNALISTSLLHFPKQEISFKQAKTITLNLHKYITDRQLLNYISATPQNYDFMQAALNLGFAVKGNPLDNK